MLFSKIPGTIYYLQHGEEVVKTQPKRPRPAAELEVRPGRSREDQIAVVVATLLDDQKSEVLDSMKTLLAKVVTELRAWERAEIARKLTMDTLEEQNDTSDATRPEISKQPCAQANKAINLEGDGMKTVVFKDGKLQLLLKLMGAERVGERGPIFQLSILKTDDPDARWIFSSSITADDLETNLRLLRQYIDEPPTFEDGKSGSDLLRRKVPPKSSYNDEDSEPSGSSDSSDTESSEKPRRRTKKRKRRQLDDAELEARREKRRLADLEKRASIKSAARIIDSDDDDEADREFFERERELRERMAAKAAEGALRQNGTKKAKKRRQIDNEIEILGVEKLEMEQASRVSSPSIARSPEPEVMEVEDQDEEDEGLKSTKRRKVRRAISISSNED